MPINQSIDSGELSLSENLISSPGTYPPNPGGALHQPYLRAGAKVSAANQPASAFWSTTAFFRPHRPQGVSALQPGADPIHPLDDVDPGLWSFGQKPCKTPFFLERIIAEMNPVSPHLIRHLQGQRGPGNIIGCFHNPPPGCFNLSTPTFLCLCQGTVSFS